MELQGQVNGHTALKILRSIWQQCLMITWKKILDIHDCKRVAKGQDMHTVPPCSPHTEDFMNQQGLTLWLDQLMQMTKLWKQGTQYKNLCQSYTGTLKIRFTNSYFWKQYPIKKVWLINLLFMCSICDLITLDLNTSYEKTVFMYFTCNSVLL